MTMSNAFKRTDRIAEMMQRKLAQIIQQEIQEPRLVGFITISAVTVTKDLGHAKVYFTVFNGNPVETATTLNTMSGYLRSLLAKTITLRTVPQLHFVHDKSIEYATRLNRLIEEANSPENDEQIDDNDTTH